MKKPLPTLGTAVLHYITANGYNSFCFPSRIVNKGSDQYISIVTCEYDGKEHFLVLPVYYDDGEKDTTIYSDSIFMDTNSAILTEIREKTGLIMENDQKILFAGNLSSTERKVHVYILPLEDAYEEPVWAKNTIKPKKYGVAVWLPIQDYPHLLTKQTQEALEKYQEM